MLDWGRNKVQQLLVRGYSQWDIADELQIDQSTVSRDIQCLRQQAQENLKSHIQESYPRNISVVSHWVKSSVKDELGYCK
jgi:predicted transcriptional regulator